MNDSVTSTIQKISNMILIVCFIAVLFLPFLDQIFGFDKTVPRNENRALTPFPSFDSDADDISEIPERFEAYYNDQFGFRNALIKGFCLLKYGLFNASGSDNVLVGKNGWLYLQADRAVDCYRGVDPFTLEELQQWQKLMETRKAYLNDQGIYFLLVLVPNKHTVYPENLPDRFNKVNDFTRMDQLVEHLRQHSEIDVLDLRDCLIRGKEDFQVYERTGTHWNDAGILISCIEIVEHLQAHFPKLEPNPMENFDLRSETTQGYGLARMLGMAEELKEEQVDFIPKTTRAQQKEREAHIRNAGIKARVFEQDDDRLPRLVLVGDSFGARLGPVLSHSFSRSIYTWHIFDEKVIEKESPDILITEIAERYLMMDLPENPGLLRDLYKSVK